MTCKLTPEEIDDSLPPNVCATSSSKAQMLYIAEALRCLTDEDHGLTAKELSEALAVRTGKAPSEPKVLRDLHLLSENAPFGMEIETPARGKNGGFKCIRHFITSSQTRLLINMVHTCKFITPTQRRELIESLHNMVSFYQQDAIVEEVHADDRERPSTPDVFLAADKAAEAIKKNRCLRFNYIDRTFWEEYLISDPDSGEPLLFEETPIALIYSFGNYYLETWFIDEEGSGKRFTRRLDKMRNPSVSDAPALNCPEVETLRSSVKERTTQVFDMWGDGVPRTLFLEVDSFAAKYIYDRFGTNMKFEHVSTDQATGYACIVVQLSPTFFRWLFGMQGSMKLFKPPSALWADDFWKNNPKAKKNHDLLICDYEEAARQYREIALLVPGVQ